MTLPPTARDALLLVARILIGVVLMNFHGYLILRGGGQGDGALDRFFNPWTGPLSTRFAATFVLVAGRSSVLASIPENPFVTSATRRRRRLP